MIKKHSKALVLLIGIIMLTLPCQAEDRNVYKLDKIIVVTASRSPLSAHELARNVIVLDKARISGAPVRSLQELLISALGGDVRQRGPSGVQADIGIRGGSFQQTLILVDGIKTSDPQTGHHNLDLPFTLKDVSRIEILKGPGSKLYGPNAMNGVVNIITESPEANRLHLESAAGDFGLSEQSLAVSYSHGIASHRLSLGRRNSTGHRDNTEFDIRTLSYGSNIRSGAGYVGLMAGYTEKQFGADRFYSDAYPDEWEATETTFLSLRADQKLGSVSLAPKIFWRRHKDDFILDRNRPDWYRNRHTSDHYGAEFQTGLKTSYGQTIIGGELSGEEIKSSSLGNHSRTRGGMFFEQQLTAINNFSIIPGFSVYNHSDWGWEFWPGLDLGYRFAGSARVYFAVGKAYRVPTFTELYYRSPANIGNPNLQPEHSWAYELGAGFQYRRLSSNLSIFLNKGVDMIDWTKEPSATQWLARNVSEHNTGGIELGMELTADSTLNWLPFDRIDGQYTYLDVTRSSGDLQSKYLLDHLQHQLTIDLGKNFSRSFQYRWNFRYSKRFQDEGYLVVDSRVSWLAGNLEIFFDITNLFNTAYAEIGTIPMPGRWFRIGLKYDLSFDQ